MHSSDRSSRGFTGRRRRLAALMAAAALLGVGGTIPAGAQDDAGQTGDELFGIYNMDARGLGVQGTYLIEGLIPGGTPVLDLGMPETVARLGSGPSGYGLASLAYPGGVLANFGTLVAQSGGNGDDIPPYPIKAEAFYPAGPTEADQSQQGGTTQRVTTDERSVQSIGAFPGIDADPLVSVGSVTSASRTSIEGELAVSRSRVVLSDVSVLSGILTMASVTTDLVAAHDGTTGSTGGGTIASGVQFLGLDAAFTKDGLVLQEAPPVAPIGGPLGGAAEPLSGFTGPVQEQLAAVLAQATPSVDDMLARAGIRVTMLAPEDQEVLSGAAARSTTGLSITMSYEGREQEAMVQLVNSIPAELKPSIGPIPNPVTFFAENHISGVQIAPASVSALATPPFGSFELPDSGPLPSRELPLLPEWETGLDDPGFATAVSPLPAAPSSSTGGAGPSTTPISNAAGAAVPAILMALALLVSPLFGMGSSRLADNVLAPVSTSCPTGHDLPQPPTGSS